MNPSFCDFSVDDKFSIEVIDKKLHDKAIAEKDARIREIEVSLAGSQCDCKFQRWEKDRSSARADLLEIENRKLKAEYVSMTIKMLAKDAEIAELKRQLTGDTHA